MQRELSAKLTEGLFFDTNYLSKLPDKSKFENQFLSNIYYTTIIVCFQALSANFDELHIERRGILCKKTGDGNENIIAYGRDAKRRSGNTRI